MTAKYHNLLALTYHLKLTAYRYQLLEASRLKCAPTEGEGIVLVCRAGSDNFIFYRREGVIILSLPVNLL